MPDDPSFDMFNQTAIATEIGFIIMFSANLEAFLPNALAKMLRLNRDTAYTMLGQVDNLSAKLGIVLEVARLRSGRPLADELLLAKDTVLAAVAKRNALAHSGYGFPPPSGELVLMANALNAGRRGKPKNVALKTDELRAHAVAIKQFIAIIRKHCGNIVSLRQLAPEVRAVASHGKGSQASPTTKPPRKARPIRAT